MTATVWLARRVGYRIVFGYRVGGRILCGRKVDYAAAGRVAGFCSPGQRIEAARIDTLDGAEVLRVTASTLVELSVTAEPSRTGTSVEVGLPRRVPSPDWEALHTDSSAFGVPIASRSDRMVITFPGQVEVA